jgi:hypothetical protein
MPIVTTSKRGRSQVASRKSKIFVIAAVAIAAIVAVYLGARVTRPRQPQPPEVPDTTAKPATPKVPDAPVATEMGPKVLEPEPPTNIVVAATTNDYVKKPGQMMLPNGTILTFPPPKEGETTKVLANGRIYECDSEGNWRDTTKRKLFDNAFESNFANLAIEGRSFIPAFLVGLDPDAVMKTLKKDYVLKGDETEEELAEINAFVEMKGVALDYIEQGGTFDEFVTEMASFVQAERKIRANSLKQVMLLYKDGKIEEAKTKAESLNAMLAEEGYKPIKLPIHVRRAFGEEVDE